MNMVEKVLVVVFTGVLILFLGGGLGSAVKDSYETSSIKIANALKATSAVYKK